jgi:SpoVK/Ycf46/Vps4 family AAA+-type ATPase
VLFFFAEDQYYYTKSSIQALTEEYNIEEIILMPELDDIKSSLQKADKTGFIAPYLPSSIDSRFEKSNFFEIIYLKNKFGVLTTGQKNAGVKEEEALKEKLGINIHKPTLTLADYGGADHLIEEAKKLWAKEKYGFQIKGFMLAGIPGTGKSFFAKCIAGETNRLLVELNLSQFMEQQDTILKINMVFEYFINNPGRYILWIDEIEKMLVGEKAQQVLGVLLTRINDLNGNGASNLFIIATANNISELAKKNPEFLRNGRFDFLLFMLPPTEENAVVILNIYLRKASKDFKNNVIPRLILNAVNGDFESEGLVAREIQNEFLHLIKKNKSNIKGLEDASAWCLDHPDEVENTIRERPLIFDPVVFAVKAMATYRKSVSTDRFIYTPAEIQYIVEDVFFSHFFQMIISKNKNIDSKEEQIAEFYSGIISKYQPLQVTLASSLDAMKGAASGFIHI